MSSQYELWLLERKEELVNVDEIASVVVACRPGEVNARGVASRKALRGDQSVEVWKDPSTTATLIATNAVATKPGVVHENFRPG